MSKTHILAVSAVCFSEHSLSVGVAQAHPNLKLSVIASAFSSDPAKRIKPLVLEEGH